MWFHALFLLSLALLAFVGGSIITLSEGFPTGYIRDAHKAGTALIAKNTHYSDRYASDLWAPARTEQRGVTVHDPDRARPGLTLYTSGHDARAILMDMDGRVVHEWHRPYSELWDESAAVRNPVPDTQVYFRKARVFPNGDLLVVYDGVGDTPWGYGMARLDRDSNVLWKNLDRFHHAFTVAADGRVYGLTHHFRDEILEGTDHFTPPILEDFLVVLSPEGETLKQVSLLDALNRSGFRRLLWQIPYYSLEDPLHTNDVEVLDHAMAERLGAKVPQAAPGQVLLSFREVAGGTLALLDPDKEEIVWALRGSWMSQHDPDILPNGNILLFDNHGHFGDAGRSRVVEVDPGNGRIVWSYAGSAQHPFESRLRAAQEPLDNGNVLITESDGGRLLEVTSSGEIVWEFVNPVRAGEDDQYIPVVSWAQRIAPESLQAEFHARIGQALSYRR
jgi:hypothetical protein